MNIPILIASFLCLIAFLLHSFIGDKELRMVEPLDINDDKYIKQEKWTMSRCGWHWVSIDLLFATVGLVLINFTNYLENEKLLLRILAVYFLSYGISWLFGIIISKRFPSNFLKLGQWILCFILSGLIFWGSLQ